MKFENSEILYHLLWLIPFIIIIYIYALNKRRNILKTIFGKRFNSQEYINVSKNRRFFRFILFLISIIFFFIALSRPQWGEQLLPYSQKSRDLLVLLDLSKSMLSQDIKPTRLKHSKWLIAEVAKNSIGDRIGLIGFAGFAFLECPLTSDKTSFSQILDSMNPNTIPVGGTNIQKALEMARNAFRGSEGKHKAIILFSDGDELSGDSSAVIAELEEKQIPIFVIGIGDPNEPGVIQFKDENGNVKYLRDRSGKTVKSKLNEKQLMRLAQKTDGIYIRSTAVNPQLKTLLKEIKLLIPKEKENGKQIQPIERFHYPLIFGFLFLLMWFIFPERVGYKKLESTL